MKVIAVLEGYTPRYITDEANITQDRDLAAVFNTPYDTDRLNSFLDYIRQNFTPNVSLEVK